MTIFGHYVTYLEIVLVFVALWLIAGVALWTLADSSSYADTMKGWK